MSKKLLNKLFALLLILSLALVACGGDNDTDSDQTVAIPTGELKRKKDYLTIRNWPTVSKLRTAECRQLQSTRGRSLAL